MEHCSYMARGCPGVFADVRVPKYRTANVDALRRRDAAQTQSPKVLLTSGIMELGAEETAILRELGAAARGVFARVIFTTDAGRSAFAEGLGSSVERLDAQTVPVASGSLLACVGRMPLSMVSRMLPGEENPKSALRRAQGDTAIFHFPFSIFHSPIHHIFAPLADRRQRLLALTLSYAPWHYRRGPATDKLRAALEERFGMYTALFSSGREGLLALLRAAEIGAGDEVIVQGFTCMVVPNAIRTAGATPVYADIEPDTLTLDVADVERRITPRTKAILCQHTFGIPADTERLRTLCDRHNILLIEDCAHVLPDDPYSVIGRHGDAMLLSFGRDKAISGVAGGAMLCRDAKCATRLRDSEDHAADLPLTTVIRLLEYPHIYAFARPLYGIGIGKGLLWIAGRLRLLIPILTSDERRGRMDAAVHRIPNVCAALALDQFQRLRTINDHRRMLTRLYAQAFKEKDWPMLDGITPDLPLQKFPLFLENAEAIRRTLKQQNIYLDDGWTGCVICPRTADASAAGYVPGGDPCAEDAARGILSLPTHPGMTPADAHRIVEAIAPFLA
jgi:dTDP-4-amino-4,6-dideoxygalactose transaminase